MTALLLAILSFHPLVSTTLRWASCQFRIAECYAAGPNGETECLVKRVCS